MKLEVGMYVRTDDGEISKIEWFTFQRWEGLDNTVEASFWLENKERLEYPRDNFKASHNIIDLIEPMDLMYIDISPDDCDGIVVPRIAETLRELNDFKERFASGNCILKGVVTKEQIKAKTYWVGE